MIGEDVVLEKSSILSEFEHVLLFALAEGKNPTEIKKLLSCDNCTLRHAEIRIMKKLEAKTKVHMITKAFSKGLLFTRTLHL